MAKAFSDKAFPSVTWGKVQRQPPLPPGRRVIKPLEAVWYGPTSGSGGGDAGFNSVGWFDSFGSISGGSGGGVGGTAGFTRLPVLIESEKEAG